MDNIFKVGYAKVNITPPMGIKISGYYQVRIADGVLDELEAVALTFNLNDVTTAIVSIDCLGISKAFADRCKDAIVKKTGLDRDALFLHGTHTHTGPVIEIDRPSSEDGGIIAKNNEFLIDRISDAVMLSLQDLKPAKMGYGIGQAPNISYIRRFIMKDGSTKTNPGVNNPDIVGTKGTVDERVSVVRFDREGAETIVLANFGTHPDTIGGTKISGDWPGFTRRFVEKSIDNTKCIFLNGAEGDVNHVNVFPKGGDLNGMFIDFDDVSRGYSHAIHMGRVVTGAIMQVYENVKYVPVETLKYAYTPIDFEPNKGTAEELVTAHEIMEIHKAGRDSELPYKGLMLTTILAKSNRMIMLENAPDILPMYFSAISLGPISFFGIPGEPFTAVGAALKETEGFELVIPCCLTNGYNGYFPTKDAFNGYEGVNARWKEGTAEKIIEEGQKILKNLR